MVFDLKVLKRVGINMVRKHIKVEPALYYKACDGTYHLIYSLATAFLTAS